MNAEVMLDTNVVAYAASKMSEDAAKRNRALELIYTAPLGISAQVLQEFFVTVTRKMRTPLSHDEALNWLAALEGFPCVPVDNALVLHGAQTAQRYQISYWDGSIVAAAERLGASVLYTEDLNDGQQYGSVTAVNPFREN